MAFRKQISREDYVRSVVRGEFETLKKTNEFFHKYPLDDPNTKDNPHYASLMITLGDFGDYFRGRESSGDWADYLNHYREAYDDMVSPEADRTKMATRESHGAMLTFGDQPLIFTRRLNMGSSRDRRLATQAI